MAETVRDYPPGTIVQWTNRFLRNTGQGPKGPAGSARAIVLDRPDLNFPGAMGDRYLVVQWDGAPEPTVVALANVARRRTAKLLDNDVRAAGSL